MRRLLLSRLTQQRVRERETMQWSEWDQNLKIRLVGEWLFGLFFWMFLPFMAIYFSETLGKTTAGLLLVLSQVLSVAANLVGGYLTDTFGRKRK
jgi:DHA1 family multidrug resistance protein B-like MFS transporter